MTFGLIITEWIFHGRVTTLPNFKSLLKITGMLDLVSFILTQRKRNHNIFFFFRRNFPQKHELKQTFWKRVSPDLNLDGFYVFWSKIKVGKKNGACHATTVAAYSKDDILKFTFYNLRCALNYAEILSWARGVLRKLASLWVLVLYS